MCHPPGFLGSQTAVRQESAVGEEPRYSPGSLPGPDNYLTGLEGRSRKLWWDYMLVMSRSCPDDTHQK